MYVFFRSRYEQPFSYQYKILFFLGNSPEEHKEREVIETENSQQESTPVHEEREKVEDKTNSADCGP